MKGYIIPLCVCGFHYQQWELITHREENGLLRLTSHWMPGIKPIDNAKLF